MVRIRYKEVARTFNFIKAINFESIPTYGKDYIYSDEIVLGAYRVGKDIGLITNKKIILFDNTQSLGLRKEITTIPYSSITAHSVIFHSTTAEIYLLLETSNPLLLKFSDMKDIDKLRLRLLYNAMSASICNQEIPKNILKKLLNNDFGF